MSNSMKVFLATFGLVVVVSGVAFGAFYVTTNRAETVQPQPQSTDTSDLSNSGNDLPSGLSSDSDSDLSNDNNPKDGAQASTQFGDGQYAVGVDIKPGTYATQGAGDCKWRRLSSLTGNRNVNAEGGFTGPGTVTIEASDKIFEAKRCGTWTLQ